jgi:monofunctional chorismate mutase
MNEMLKNIQLENLRCEINEIDNQLLNLLQKRQQVSIKIGEYKKQNNLPIFDSKREIKLLERLTKLNMESVFKLDNDFIKETWVNIMNYSKKQQK